MSYKENKNFKNYCSKHKNVKKSVETLELFCKDNCVVMDIFGSMVRKDYYYGKSDCDTVFVSNNIDKTCVNFEDFVRNNDCIEIKKKKYTHYSLDNETVKCPGVMYKIVLYNSNFDVVIVNKKDYDHYNNLITPKIDFITNIIVSIIKFFYYQIPIIPLSFYIHIKHVLFKKRLHIVKDVKYKK